MNVCMHTILCVCFIMLYTIGTGMYVKFFLYVSTYAFYTLLVKQLVPESTLQFPYYFVYYIFRVREIKCWIQLTYL